MRRCTVIKRAGTGFAPGGRRALCRSHRIPCGLGRLISVGEQQFTQSFAQVPLDVISEHAQEDMCPHPISQAMMNRANPEIDGLECAERSLHLGVGLSCQIHPMQTVEPDVSR